MKEHNKTIKDEELGTIKIEWETFLKDISSLYLSIIRDKFVPSHLYATAPEDLIVAGILGDRYDFAVNDAVASEKPLLITIVPKPNVCYDFLQLGTQGKMAVLYDIGSATVIYDFVGRVMPYKILFPWKI